MLKLSGLSSISIRVKSPQPPYYKKWSEIKLGFKMIQFYVKVAYKCESLKGEYLPEVIPWPHRKWRETAPTYAVKASLANTKSKVPMLINNLTLMLVREALCIIKY